MLFGSPLFRYHDCINVTIAVTQSTNLYVFAHAHIEWGGGGGAFTTFTEKNEGMGGDKQEGAL